MLLQKKRRNFQIQRLGNNDNSNTESENRNNIHRSGRIRLDEKIFKQIRDKITRPNYIYILT